MDLKTLLPKGKKVEHYWSLIIEPGWTQAGIWKIEGEKVDVVSVSPTTAWELEEDLIEAVDTVLSAAIQNLPDDQDEPSKTVFGVISSWVAEGQIKKQYLELIKNICNELSLEPVGFVVLPEAMANLIKSEEGGPVNSVLIGLAKEFLEFSIFKLGKLQGTTKVSRSVSIADDVTEGLARFDQGEEVLPSRFILYNGKEGDLDEVKQSLVKVNWEDYEDLKFLHSPKIEIISTERKLHAVCLAGGSELAGIQELAMDEEEKEDGFGDDPENTGRADEISNVGIPEEELTPEELGFALNEDITEKEEEKLSQPDEAAKHEVPPPKPSKKLEKEVSNMGRTPERVRAADEEFISQDEEKAKSKASRLGFFGNLKSKLSGLVPSLGRPKISGTIPGKPLYLGILFLFIFIAGGFLFWMFYPRAEITIYISPKRLDEIIDIEVEPNRSTADLENKVLPGEVLRTAISGEKTKSTTGTKTVGDRATGEVTLYRVGSQMSLPAGTAVHGPNDLSFSLDEAVTVASGSASSPGTSKASVTAQDIGAEYNLASGTSFSVGTYTTADIEARNESDFSGGSSREINAVSQEDQDELLSELEDELRDQGLEELREIVGEDQILIEDSLSSEVSSTDFSEEVGDEAASLKLSLSSDFQAVAVSKEALTNMAKETLKEKVPDGFTLRDDQIEVEFEYNREAEGIFEIEAFVKANLLPQVDPEKIKTDIVGKYPPLAEDYFIREIPGFSRAQIDMRRLVLPGRLGTLPRVKKNIEIIIAAER